MGCTDSTVAEKGDKPLRKKKQKKVEYQRTSEEEEDPVSSSRQEDENKRQNLHSPVKTKHQSKSKGKGVKYQDDVMDKENVVKVKKAKELDSKPEHDKFISDIVQKSKKKLAPSEQQTEDSVFGLGKPVVEYKADKKGSIIPEESIKRNKTNGNRQITEEQNQILQNLIMGEDYVAVNQNPKSPYKTKQIEKRLNNIRNGHVRAESIQVENIESNKTVYL